MPRNQSFRDRFRERVDRDRFRERVDRDRFREPVSLWEPVTAAEAVVKGPIHTTSELELRVRRRAEVAYLAELETLGRALPDVAPEHLAELLLRAFAAVGELVLEPPDQGDW